MIHDSYTWYVMLSESGIVLVSIFVSVSISVPVSMSIFVSVSIFVPVSVSGYNVYVCV